MRLKNWRHITLLTKVAGEPMTAITPVSMPSRVLTIRLAQNAADIVAVQRLRWKVFCEEGGASADTSTASLDMDAYDPLCDHLLVIDENAPCADRVVGTYRLLRESVAAKNFGFYSASEFDLGQLLTSSARPIGELLELGRSCVLPTYRTSATISMLWRGIADYITQHGIGLMFGCGSFHGTDPDAHAASLSWLHHNHLADQAARPGVLDGKGIPLEQLAEGSYDPRKAMLALPPLIKGYLRLGAKVGDGAFIDTAFNTIDVCIVMPVDLITGRYAARFNLAA
jgi:putative hemolysin